MRRTLPLVALALALLLPAAAGGADDPETTITAGPPAVANTGSATFTFTSNDTRAHFACSLDSGPFSTCTSPYSLTVAEGQHHFEVVAIVEGTSDPTPPTWTWTVDTIPPAPVKARVSVGYGRFALSWGSLETLGASRVTIYRSMSEKQAASQEIYRGSGRTYVDRKFHNGAYHRYRAVTVDAAGNVGPAVEFVVGPDAMLISPKQGAKLRAPLRVRWRAAPKATFYNAQLYRSGTKVLSAWPRTAQMTVQDTWRYKGHRYRLKAGQYTVYVWPGFGPLQLGRYGQLLGQSSFRVA
jgi:hypothetical protein